MGLAYITQCMNACEATSVTKKILYVLSHCHFLVFLIRLPCIGSRHIPSPCLGPLGVAHQISGVSWAPRSYAPGLLSGDTCRCHYADFYNTHMLTVTIHMYLTGFTHFTIQWTFSHVDKQTYCSDELTCSISRPCVTFVACCFV